MAIPINMASKTLDELKTLVANHERIGKTDTDRCRAAIAELTRRSTAELVVEKTMGVIAAAARKGAFVSYKEVADASGMPANRLNLVIPKHLLEVNRHAHGLGLPMISAIVVTQQHLVDGKMEPRTLSGFCQCARSLDIDVGDEAAFLATQQQAVFLAAKEGRLT